MELSPVDILVVGREPGPLCSALKEAGVACGGATTARSARSAVDQRRPRLALLAAGHETLVDDAPGVRVIDVQGMTPREVVALVVADSAASRAVTLIDQPTAFLPDVSSPRQASRADIELESLTWRFPQLAAVRATVIIGDSASTRNMLREILLRAPGRDPVLIEGDTGTGKTGAAEALWRLGPRADRPFRVVNAAELAATDDNITLGKLFGYGMNSGIKDVPREGQPGLLEELDGGILFIDEIHQLPRAAQAMLLLPLEGRPFNPAVGRGLPRRADVKFIAASNRNLPQEVAAGRFPDDLLQRLGLNQIHVPALCERREDIPRLAEHFLREAAPEFGIDNASFSTPLMKYLCARKWPGNVRELRGLVRELARRAAFAMQSELTIAELPPQERADV